MVSVNLVLWERLHISCATKVGAGILRSRDTRTPMFAAVVGNTINAVGDYALIFGALGCPRLGVKGAAIATLVAP